MHNTVMLNVAEVQYLTRSVEYIEILKRVQDDQLFIIWMRSLRSMLSDVTHFDMLIVGIAHCAVHFIVLDLFSMVPTVICAERSRGKP